MTMYAIFREEGDTLKKLAEVDHHSPERAVEKFVREQHASGNGGGVANEYVVGTVGSLSHVKVEIAPSVAVTVTSDREVKPRKQQAAPEPAKA